MALNHRSAGQSATTTSERVGQLKNIATASPAEYETDNASTCAGRPFSRFRRAEDDRDRFKEHHHEGPDRNPRHEHCDDSDDYRCGPHSTSAERSQSRIRDHEPIIPHPPQVAVAAVACSARRRGTLEAWEWCQAQLPTDQQVRRGYAPSEVADTFSYVVDRSASAD